MHPVLVKIGPVVIRYYGLMYVLAISLGFVLFAREARRKELPLSTEALFDLLLWIIPSALVGARLYYVAFQWDYYGQHLVDIVKLWQGGLAIHGGVIAGLLAVFLYARVKRVRFWALTDALTPSLILGQAIGRIGNLTNGDAFGLPTTLPWGLRFPLSSPAGQAFPGQATHPSMLYEMILNLMIFALLWVWARKRGFRDGFVTALYFILYAVARSIVSFTRADSLWLGELRTIEVTVGGYQYETVVGSFRAAHAISIAFVIGFGLFILLARLYRRDPRGSDARDRTAAPADPR
ncbi:MAG: prolipoprotein diacylglyceryl transferase [Candidatus Bipolaricaulota bacterium]|nr:MAG: prolipoprotein diacylglyceryl transferase [Candidatus Bipolaricaulota bacterium]